MNLPFSLPPPPFFPHPATYLRERVVVESGAAQIRVPANIGRSVLASLKELLSLHLEPLGKLELHLVVGGPRDESATIWVVG